MHGLSCSAACGIFLDQELNPCFLQWQMGSLPLSHQESPKYIPLSPRKPQEWCIKIFFFIMREEAEVEGDAYICPGSPS